MAIINYRHINIDHTDLNKNQNNPFTAESNILDLNQKQNLITYHAYTEFDSVKSYKAWCKRFHITPDLPDSES